jgi:phage/plasmid-like protein (TIGR03299 family)
MSYHSMQYLNRKMKKGNCETTGYAWWYDANLEDPQHPSHYKGFIPLDTVIAELFGWTAEESAELLAKFRIATPPGKLEDGVTNAVKADPVLDAEGNPVVNEIGDAYYDFWVPVDTHKAIGRGDWIVNGIPDDEELGASKILSINDIDYGTHQLKDVFVSNVAELVEGEDNIGMESAGILKWGRRAFASLSIPENLRNDDSGMDFRPILTVVTSFDRTLATKYVRTYGVPVCDNTLNYELVKAGEKDGQFVLRHTKNSALRLRDAKQVLGLLTTQAEEMNTFLGEMVRAEVPEDAFIAWLDVMVPIPEIKKTLMTVKSIQGEDVQVEKVSANAQTIALKKRDKLVEMWDKDPRVSPWKNTRLGVLQLWNTFQQHEVSFKGAKQHDGNKTAARVEMNANKTIEGAFAREDEKALNALSIVMAKRDEEVKVAVPAGAPTSDPAKKAPAKRASRSKAQNN